VLNSLKEELAFTYDIPNRQYLSAKIDIRLKEMKMSKSRFKLKEDSVKANTRILSAIRVLVPKFEESGLLNTKTYQIMNITKDECTLSVRNPREDDFYFEYEGDEDDAIFQYLSSHDC
jgi:hypothetical protein